MPIALTAAGTYRVAYRIVSNDGHPIEGSYSFTFAGIDGAEPAPAFAERPECGVAQEPIPVAVPTEEPTVIAPTPSTAPDTGVDLAPWIGVGGVALLGGAVWVLFRTLGRSDSEDDVN
jgi:LPXTG-motif cell wall-anchored protein